MAATFQFELVSPERLLLSTEVSEVIVPGTDGEFTVLPNHAPMMTTIRPGILSVKTEGSGDREEYVLLGGFAEAGPDRLTILAEEAYVRSELDKDALASSIRDTEEDARDAQTDEARALATERLEQLKTLEALA
ncbi:MAG: F0F1 ATP synthase subunit epsilon [Hyphomicrobiales bacterium]|nr:F0F1 ATP synthase subunit epsilon [Hyphomicrobiales bacterium]